MPSTHERLMAACMHLGYIPVALAFLGAIIVPKWVVGFALFSLVWTIAAMAWFQREPRQEFLRSHLLEARRYHRFAVVSALLLLAFLVYVTIFTWGGGAILFIGLIPLAVMWMAPTWKAAVSAYRGRPYEYRMSNLGTRQDLTVSGVPRTPHPV